MRNYFRQSSQDSPIKLPLKWMSPESIKLGIFSEKSDVVSTRALRLWGAVCVKIHCWQAFRKVWGFTKVVDIYINHNGNLT